MKIVVLDAGRELEPIGIYELGPKLSKKFGEHGIVAIDIEPPKEVADFSSAQSYKWALASVLRIVLRRKGKLKTVWSVSSKLSPTVVQAAISDYVRRDEQVLWPWVSSPIQVAHMEVEGGQHG